MRDKEIKIESFHYTLWKTIKVGDLMSIEHNDELTLFLCIRKMVVDQSHQFRMMMIQNGFYYPPSWKKGQVRDLSLEHIHDQWIQKGKRFMLL